MDDGKEERLIVFKDTLLGHLEWRLEQLEHDFERVKDLAHAGSLMAIQVEAQRSAVKDIYDYFYYDSEKVAVNLNDLVKEEIEWQAEIESLIKNT